MKILYICGALAAGEFAASAIPETAEAWPFAVIVAALVALFGYGADIRGWKFAFLFLAGIALFLHASIEGEQRYREQPWMRGRIRNERRETASTTYATRQWFARRIAIGLERDRDVVKLNRAILLGRRLPQRMRKTFSSAGTAHVFAISGLHVMAVAKVLTVVMSLLLVPRRFAGAAALPVLWGYVHLIGWSPSAVRAAMMATFYYAAPIFWRRPNGISAWGLTFLVVHVGKPQMITNTSCALSFAVMLAIILAGRYGRGLAGWKNMLWMTCAAWAAGVPIAAHTFGQVAPGGMLANLVLIAAAGGTVMAGTAGVAASFVSRTLAAHLNNLSALFTWLMVGVSEAVSRLPFACFATRKWTLPECAAWYAVILLGLYLAHSVRTRKSLG